jgi:HSP20 family molecular chaperone IbpA
LYLTIALPGVDAQRIEVHLNGGHLVVSGFRPLPALARGAQIHRLELPYGRFERRIALPAGQYELTTHKLQHGCLQINLHKV